MAFMVKEYARLSRYRQVRLKGLSPPFFSRREGYGIFRQATELEKLPQRDG
jgi:hypothetical protein